MDSDPFNRCVVVAGPCRDCAAGWRHRYSIPRTVTNPIRDANAAGAPGAGTNRVRPRAAASRPSVAQPDPGRLASGPDSGAADACGGSSALHDTRTPAAAGHADAKQSGARTAAPPQSNPGWTRANANTHRRQGAAVPDPGHRADSGSDANPEPRRSAASSHGGTLTDLVPRTNPECAAFPDLGTAAQPSAGFTHAPASQHADADRHVNAFRHVDAHHDSYHDSHALNHDLDPEAIRLAATRFAGASGGLGQLEIAVHRAVDSTMEVARALASAGAPHGTLVVSDHQTAGRGRLGRVWVAAPNSSALLTVLFRPAPEEVASLVTLLPMAAAVGCRAGIAAVAPEAQPVLKWPNDILHGSTLRKLGGVLIEAIGRGDDPRGDEGLVFLVGVGINVRSDPLRPAEATCLEDTGFSGHRAEVIGAVVGSLGRTYLATLAGVSPRAEFKEHLVTLGRRVETRTGAGPSAGTAVDVAPDGSLVLDVDGVLATVRSGDVFEGDQAPSA